MDGSPESTMAGIVTSFATVITALGGLVLAIGVLIPILRNSRRTLTSIAEVHTIVNQQRTDMQRYQTALVEVLKKHNIEIPVDQSLPVGLPETPEPILVQMQTPIPVVVQEEGLWQP